MKRFYADVSVDDAGGIRLDGRPVRTPGRALLELPTPALAEAVAAEWRAQGDTMDPATMRLTGLANAAIDQVAPDPARFAAATLNAYAETDLLLYRADAPEPLVARQAAGWDPILAQASARYDVGFTIATGIVHRAQPAATVARLQAAVNALDPFRMTALQPLVTIGGSLIVALGVVDGTLGSDDGWAATRVDEDWQAEQWGEDALALAARDARHADWDAAARFLALLG